MPSDAVQLLQGVTFVTGNPGKLAEARRLCGVDLRAVEIDLPEIQSLDIREVLRAKAAAALQRLQRPVVVDETALELAALNGFPGVLIKWMLHSVGAEGIGLTAQSLGDMRATARCGLLYLAGEQEVFAEGTTDGQLVLPPRGDAGFGWDPIFQPDDHDKTYAELSGPEKDHLSHRGLAWRHLVQRLGEIENP